MANVANALPALPSKFFLDLNFQGLRQALKVFITHLIMINIIV